MMSGGTSHVFNIIGTDTLLGVVARGVAAFRCPKKIGLKGSIPAMVSITVGSSGIKEALGKIWCALAS